MSVIWQGECGIMGGEQSSVDRRYPGKTARPEALEFARTGRVDNRLSSIELRERLIAQTVLFVLLCIGVIVGCVFLLV